MVSSNFILLNLLTMTYRNILNDREYEEVEVYPGCYHQNIGETPSFSLGRMMVEPSANILEREEQIIIQLGIPGIRREDIKVCIKANSLIVQGQKENTFRTENSRSYKEEYNYAAFSRSFEVPAGIDHDLVEAKYENGELTILMPKMEAGLNSTAVKTIAVY
jgi:HSP20 family protein